MLKDQIRQLLLAEPDGLTASELVDKTGATVKSVRHSLSLMDDAYIDRWTPAGKRQVNYSAVWCVVPIPEDCPHPTRNRK